MGQLIEIHWAAGSIEEARFVCRYLVSERLVACAQIIPWIESIYQWNNQLETTQESKVLLKTDESYFEEVKEVILKNTKYEVPEITSVVIHQVNSSYEEWLKSSMESKKSL